MNSHITKIAPILVLVVLLSSCTSTSTNNEQPTKDVPKATSESNISSHNTPFPLPDIPVMIIDPEEETKYLAKHYWDLFPFDDTTLIVQPDITEQGIVDFIHLLKSLPLAHAQNALQTMLNKAEAQPAMYDHFISLYEKYLYDPNSPFRDDELYIVVVEDLLKSGQLTVAQQEVYNFQHEMLLKNRRGTTATDFVYTLNNGQRKNMHNIQSSYLLLYITNPGCQACASTTEAISQSKILKSIFDLNTPTSKMLTVLSLYPDSDLEEWRNALPDMPQKNWIHAYDKGSILLNKRLYDIKAIPTLYLLDKQKQIILKDTSIEDIEAFFMNVR